MSTSTPKKKRKKPHHQTLKSLVKYNHLAHLIKPVAVTGSDISKVTETFGLHLTEASLMLGLNTSSLYEKKKKDEHQPANISMLLRLYAALPEYLPRFEPPPIKQLIQKIQSIDPEFDRSWIGILLGLEKNSSFRLRRDGFERGAQTTKMFAYLIDKMITDNPKNWFLIREVVETEAAARGINPAENIWIEGGWNRNLDNYQSNKRPKIEKTDSIILNSNLESHT